MSDDDKRFWFAVLGYWGATVLILGVLFGCWAVEQWASHLWWRSMGWLP